MMLVCTIQFSCLCCCVVYFQLDGRRSGLQCPPGERRFYFVRLIFLGMFARRSRKLDLSDIELELPPPNHFS